MSLERFLRVVTEALGAAGIPSMITGSIAAAFHGASRATMNVDLVIDPTADTLTRFVRRIEELEWYVSADAARDALAHQRMFNVIDPETGWKADLVMRKHRPFSEAEFARREAVDFFGLPIAVASLEDLILAKMEWARLGASARQLDDVRALLRIAGEGVDRSYLEGWIDALGVRAEWDSVHE